MEIKNNKTIISTSPLIYYAKYRDHLEFYHETFDTLIDSLNIHNDLGIKLAKEKKLNESRIAFLNGLNEDSKNVVILNNLGNLERFAKNFKKSIEYYKKSFAESGSLYFVAGLNLAKVLSIIGEKTESEKEFYAIINNSNLDFIQGISYYQLTEKHLRYGDLEKGYNTLKQAKKFLNNDPNFNTDLIALQKKLTIE